MAIPLMSGFSIGSSDSVDSRLVLTKAEMLAMKDSGMPDTYFCTDKDTGDIYTYNKTNTADPTTGKFRKFAGGGSGSGLPEPTDVDQLLISYKDENNELKWKQIDKSEVSGAGYRVVTDIDKEIGITQDTRVILTENQSITLPTVYANPQNKIGVKVTVMVSGRGCSFNDGSTVLNVPERSYADVLWNGEKWIYGKALAIWV